MHQINLKFNRVPRDPLSLPIGEARWAFGLRLATTLYDGADAIGSTWKTDLVGIRAEIKDTGRKLTDALAAVDLDEAAIAACPTAGPVFDFSELQLAVDLNDDAARKLWVSIIGVKIDSHVDFGEAFLIVRQTNVSFPLGSPPAVASPFATLLALQSLPRVVDSLVELASAPIGSVYYELPRRYELSPEGIVFVNVNAPD